MAAAGLGFTFTHYSVQNKRASLSQILKSPEFYSPWTSDSGEEERLMLIDLGLLEPMSGMGMVGQFHSDLVPSTHGRGEGQMFVGSSDMCSHPCPLQGWSLSHQ